MMRERSMNVLNLIFNRFVEVELYTKGEILANQGKYEAAQDIFEQIRGYISSQRDEESNISLLDTVEVQTFYSKILQNLSFIHLKQGKWKSCIKLAEESIEVCDDQSDIWKSYYYLGDAKMQIGDLEEAEPDLRFGRNKMNARTELFNKLIEVVESRRKEEAKKHEFFIREMGINRSVINCDECRGSQKEHKGINERRIIGSPPPDSVICPICKYLLHDVYVCGYPSCTAPICGDCFSKNDHCTKCNNRTTFIRNNYVSALIHDLLSLLQYSCSNEACHQNLKYEEIPSHILKCEYQSVPCTNIGCTHNGIRSKAQVHYAECDFQLQICTNKNCGKEYKRKDIKNHINECFWKIISCLNCGEMLIRNKQCEHDIECPSYPFECEHCMQTIPSSEFKSKHGEFCEEKLVNLKCGHMETQRKKKEHKSLCGEYPVDCPLMCGILLDQLKGHDCIQFLKEKRLNNISMKEELTLRNSDLLERRAKLIVSTKRRTKELIGHAEEISYYGFVCNDSKCNSLYGFKSVCPNIETIKSWLKFRCNDCEKEYCMENCKVKCGVCLVWYCKGCCFMKCNTCESSVLYCTKGNQECNNRSHIMICSYPNCKKSLCPVGCQHMCPISQKVFCGEHVRKCTSCYKQSICFEESKECSVCGKYICKRNPECWKICDKCSNKSCNQCELKICKGGCNKKLCQKCQKNCTRCTKGKGILCSKCDYMCNQPYCKLTGIQLICHLCYHVHCHICGVVCLRCKPPDKFIIPKKFNLNLDVTRLELKNEHENYLPQIFESVRHRQKITTISFGIYIFSIYIFSKSGNWCFWEVFRRIH